MFSPCCFLIRLSLFHDKWVSHHYPVTDKSSHVFPIPINTLVQLGAAFNCVPFLIPLGATERPSQNRVPGKVWIIKMSAAAQGWLWRQWHKVLLVEFLLHPCNSLRKIPDRGQTPSLLVLLAICSHQQLGSHPVAWRRVFGRWHVVLHPLHRFWMLRKLEPLKTDNVSLTNLVTCLQHFICCNVQLCIITFRTFHCCILYVSSKYTHWESTQKPFCLLDTFPVML